VKERGGHGAHKRRRDGVSHFPPLELPNVTAADIERFIG